MHKAEYGVLGRFTWHVTMNNLKLRQKKRINTCILRYCYDLEFSCIFMSFEEKDKMLDMIRFTGIQPSAYIKLSM